MELLFESCINLKPVGKLCFFQRQPTNHPEPMLTPDTFVDDSCALIYGKVLHDGGVYRLRHQAWPRHWNGKSCAQVGYVELARWTLDD